MERIANVDGVFEYFSQLVLAETIDTKTIITATNSSVKTEVRERTRDEIGTEQKDSPRMHLNDEFPFLPLVPPQRLHIRYSPASRHMKHQLLRISHRR